MTMIDPHLDVDQLSAAVDGEQDAAVSAHLLACLACREQLTTWQTALGRLDELDRSSSPTLVDDTVDAAMAAWTPPLRRPGLRDRFSTRGVAAVAAIVVAIAAAGFGLSRISGDSSSKATATSSRAASRAKPTAGGPAGGSAGAGSATSPHSTAHATTPASGPRIVAADRASLTAQLRHAVPAAAGVAPSSRTATPPCLRAARRIEAGAGTATTRPLAYDAPVDYAGANGRVFVFARPGGHTAIVLRSVSCILVATVRF